jgi:hypothetical protein
MPNGAAISWNSQRQQTVALSTAAAEYMALTAATQEAMFLKQMLHEFRQDMVCHNRSRGQSQLYRTQQE